MPYQPWSTQGLQLQVKIGLAFMLIPGAEGIGGPTGTKNQIEVTALNDTAAKFVTGLPDLGEVTFTLFWDPSETTHQHLFTAFNETNSDDEFKILCADAGAAEVGFNGSVSGWRWNLQKNSAATVEVTVRVNGAVTVTP